MNLRPPPKPPQLNSALKLPPPPPRFIRREQAVPAESSEAFIERVTQLHAPKKELSTHIQDSLFESEEAEKNLNRIYTTKIVAPVYKPRNQQPDVFSLLDTSKAAQLIANIKASQVSEDEKRFLIEAAKRHNVFSYELIADYYAHATPDMQKLMEESALVIIDFDEALKHGFVRYTKEIAELYRKEHENVVA